MSRRRSRPTGETYRIRTLDDLLQTPDDRLRHCLDSLEMVLVTHRHLHAAIAAGGERDGQRYEAPPFAGWDWTDDGERVLTVHTPANTEAASDASP